MLLQLYMLNVIFAAMLSTSTRSSKLRDEPGSNVSFTGFCEDFALPHNRWRIYGKPAMGNPASRVYPSTGTASPPSNPLKLRVLFVPTNDRPSSIHRCVDAAHALGHDVMGCTSPKAVEWFQEVAPQYDVFVHCKTWCTWVLNGMHGINGTTQDQKVHIIDRIDSYERLAPTDSFAHASTDGEIFNSKEQMQRQCSTRACVVIPHHYNLKCAARDQPPSPPPPPPPPPPNLFARLFHGRRLRSCSECTNVTIGIVGSHDTPLVEALTSAEGVRVVFEPYTLKATSTHHLGSCGFFNEIDVAVAWKAAYVNTQILLDGKPAERLTNPVMIGVPTIGYGGYASFRELNHPNLSCTTPMCVIDLARKIKAGRLQEAAASQRDCIRKHLSAAMMSQFYGQLFGVAWHTKQTEKWRAGVRRRQ